MLNKVSQMQKDKYCMIALICGIYKSQIQKQRVEWCLAVTGKQGNREMLVKEYKSSVIQDESVLEI